jgi:hypothetical protein
MKEFSIVDFDPNDEKQMDVISLIHTSVLPNSFVVQMGKTFMKKFYYRVLPKLGYLKCFLAKYENEYVGIIVATNKPFSLIRSAIRHHFILIPFVIFTSIVNDIRRVKVLLEILKYKPDPFMKKLEDSGNGFELLTIGVLEKYRNLILKNEMKISHLLLRHAVADYKNNNYRKLSGQILKSNKGALSFYSKYNAKFIQSMVREDTVLLDFNVDDIVK